MGSFGHKVSEETKRKMSETRKGKYLSEETKLKMSLFRKGKTWEELWGKEKAKEIRKKRSLEMSGKNSPNYGTHVGAGKKLSNIHKIRISNSLKGHIVTKETGEKIGLANKGKKHSEEHKRKIGRASKENAKSNPNFGWRNKHQSEEQKKKIRENAKNNPNFGMKGKHQSLEVIKRYKEWRKTQVFPKRDTLIEVKIQNFLTQLHLEFITHKYISEITHSYQCDIFIPEQETEGVIIIQKTIIECDGCFFHCCPVCNLKYFEWTEKRKEIDNIRTQELINKGFKVIRLWGHEIKPMELNEFKERLK